MQEGQDFWASRLVPNKEKTVSFTISTTYSEKQKGRRTAWSQVRRFEAVLQWYGIPIPITLVIWASSSHITVAIFG